MHEKLLAFQLDESLARGKKFENCFSRNEARVENIVLHPDNEYKRINAHRLWLCFFFFLHIIHFDFYGKKKGVHFAIQHVLAD